MTKKPDFWKQKNGRFGRPWAGRTGRMGQTGVAKLRFGPRRTSGASFVKIGLGPPTVLRPSYVQSLLIVADIGTWRSIVELNFGTNQIQKLPDDIALLENLEVRHHFLRNSESWMLLPWCQFHSQVLIISSNMLRKLPPNIGQLQKLRVLDLAENRIDNIPNEIGRLRMLQKLILQTNNLTQLPRAIGYVIRLWNFLPQNDQFLQFL